ncbi:unnamed protein product [Closterium sp. Yama58-4]|nr:unnamed protein product [Closterium sp. Yama58-4]
MLVVLTGRPAPFESAGESRHIVSWVEECLASGTAASLTAAGMDAPADAVLRVAQLAVSCTVECTASRPSMEDIANQLQAVREEVVGKYQLSAAVKVDAQVRDMKNGMVQGESLEVELLKIAEHLAAETQSYVVTR